MQQNLETRMLSFADFQRIARNRRRRGLSRSDSSRSSSPVRRQPPRRSAKATKKKTYGHSQPTENRAAMKQFVPNVQAKLFMPNNQAVTRQDLSNNNKKDSRPNAPQPQTTQSNVAQPIDTADAPVCFYHQTFGDRARTCREPCAFSLN